MLRHEVRAASPATISASTEVSAGISARRASARVGRLVGERARAGLPHLGDVAVAVEDVVDDLEEQPELGGERPPRRRASRSGAPAARTPHMIEAVKSAPVFSRCSSARSWPPSRSLLLAADHRERRLDELARDRPAPQASASRNASASSASPARIAVASP